MGYAVLATAGVEPLFTSLVAARTVADAFGLLLCDNWVKHTPTNEVPYAWVLDNRSFMLLGNSAPIAPTDPGYPLAPTSGGQYLGEMYYTPLVTESYYNIHLRSITIGGEPLPGNLPCSAYNAPGPSLVDSGTSVTWIPAGVHAALIVKFGDQLLSVVDPRERITDPSNKLKLANFFKGDQCVRASESLIQNLPPITFTFPVDGEPDKEFGVDVLPLHYLYGPLYLFRSAVLRLEDENAFWPEARIRVIRWHAMPL
jgi:hypothetical protein